jgi:hypothetical protein
MFIYRERITINSPSMAPRHIIIDRNSNIIDVVFNNYECGSSGLIESARPATNHSLHTSGSNRQAVFRPQRSYSVQKHHFSPAVGPGMSVTDSGSVIFCVSLFFACNTGLEAAENLKSPVVVTFRP